MADFAGGDFLELSDLPVESDLGFVSLLESDFLVLSPLEDSLLVLSLLEDSLLEDSLVVDLSELVEPERLSFL